jgi:Flp pilus assembly pilin Flp
MRTNDEHTIGRWAGGERGATAVEYSILVAMIAAIIVLTVEAVGLDVAGLWGSVNW